MLSEEDSMRQGPLVCLAILGVASMIGCQQGSDTHVADEAVIRAADAATLKAAQV
jgi:hypothetical protein